MKKVVTPLNLLAVVFFLAYILSAYAFEGNHPLDLIFLIMMVASNIFRQQIDVRWENWRNKN